jgi:hypothetical protein
MVNFGCSTVQANLAMILGPFADDFSATSLLCGDFRPLRFDDALREVLGGLQRGTPPKWAAALHHSTCSQI